MENRCVFCFHPLPADGAASACHVCGNSPTTTTSPFGSSPANPHPVVLPAGRLLGLPCTPGQLADASLFGRQTAPPAMANPFSFSTRASGPGPGPGQAPPPATPNFFSFSPTPPPEPANTSSVGQTAPAPPATSSLSAFGFSTPEHWLAQPSPPPTPTTLGISPAPSGPTYTNIFGVPMVPARAVFASDPPQVPSHTTLFGRRLHMPPPPHIGSARRWCVFDDDEPVDNNHPAAAAALHGVREASTRNGPLVLKTHCELPAVARGCARASFAVLVHAKAPGAGADQAASLDLVTVLDVSSSMREGDDAESVGRSELVVARSLVVSYRSTPVHTFGFGTDHDAKAMDAVAEATGGTYSFIENQAVVQDAFAQCIGGLLSVAVQEAWISVACPHPDVRVQSMKSGRYESRVVAYGRAASVDVGELYADEERRFLLFVDVPRVADTEDVTRLIRVSCTYKDTASGKLTEVAGDDAVVRRPAEVTSAEDKKPSMEVQVERFRVEATEDITAARAAAERGDHAEAARILDRRREAAGTGDLAGDARCAALLCELAELSARVSTRREYEQTGRSSLLAGMGSHAQQRASSVNLFGCMAPSAFGSSSTPGFGSAPLFGAAFATPAMKDMVDSSRKNAKKGSSSSSSSVKR